MPPIYLDHQSTTPLLPAVRAAMEPFWEESFGNPAALHQLGLRARDALTASRAQVAALIHAPSAEGILFVSGATEAANLAVLGTAWANREYGNHLVVGATEHPAILRSVEFLERQGFQATRVAVDAMGRVAAEAVREALTDRTILIAVHHTNHDIGTVEPVAEIGALAAERGIPLYVDASASGGWVPIDVQTMSISLLSLSPHRFYGPKGVGVLYRARRARLTPLIHGGRQEHGLRAGTENVPAIVGAGTAAALAATELPDRAARTASLQRRLWDGLRNQVEGITLNGPELGPGRHPGNLHVSVEGVVEGEALVLALDLRGVALHSGASCANRSSRVPPVLTAIGLSPERAQTSVLLSPGFENTEAEIDCAIELFATQVRKLREL